MRLILGAPGAGKTSTVLREFADALTGDPATLRIIVPTATLVRHLRNELARAGVVFPPSSVVSLHRFVSDCAAGLRQTPDGVLEVLAADCLDGIPGLPRSPGVVAEILAAVKLFEDEGQGPDRLASARGLDPNAKAFARLWRAITVSLRERGLTPRPEFWKAASNNIPAGLTVWMDGFLNFSPLEGQFVAALSRRSDLTLTCDEVNEDIRRFALGQGAAEKRLPGGSRQPQEELVRAPSPEREADEIARRILELNAEGIPFRRIGVAFRDQESYTTLIQSTFTRFGIPGHFYFQQHLADHPLARFASGLVTGVLDGWNWESALDTFRAHLRWGGSPDFDRFDFAVREAMPGRGADRLLKLCESDWLRREIASVLHVESWKITDRPPAQWAERFEVLISTAWRPAVLSGAIDHAAVAAARSHAAALKAWIEAVHNATHAFADPDRPVSLEQFWHAASAVVAATTLEPSDDRFDVVHVMSVYEARQWSLDALFVCGVTSQNFPKRGQKNLFLSDERLLPERARESVRERDEQLLYHSLRTRSSEVVVFSYPARDASGKGVRPSPFLDGGHEATLAVPVRAPFGVSRPQSAGRISDPALLAELAPLHATLSVSRLEKLAQCSFQFFADKTLGLKPAPERPSARLNARNSGSIVHRVLEVWQKDRARDFVAIFDQTFESFRLDLRLPDGYRLEVERWKLREVAIDVKGTEQWQFTSSETEVELDLDLIPGIRMSGRADRIDHLSTPGECVIVDYKSGKTDALQRKLEGAAHLQGPLYALAVREKLGLDPVAVLFWAIRDDKLFGWGHIQGADTVNSSLEPMPANWATDARARVTTRLEDFFAGNIRPLPAQPDDCRFCDFRHTCRVESAPQQLVVLTVGGEA